MRKALLLCLILTSPAAAQEILTASDTALPIKAVVVEDTAAVGAIKSNWKNDIDLRELNSGWKMLKGMLDAPDVTPPETLFVGTYIYVPSPRYPTVLMATEYLGEYNNDPRPIVRLSSLIFDRPSGYFLYGALHELEHHILTVKGMVLNNHEQHCKMLHGGNEEKILSWVDSIYNRDAPEVATPTLDKLEAACGISRLQVAQLRKVADSLLKVSGWTEASRIRIDFDFVDEPEPYEAIAVSEQDSATVFYLALSQPLLELMSDRDEMAALVGHAFGHAQDYLEFNRFRKKKFAPDNALSTAGRILDHESKMDSIGIGLVRKAGYRPAAMLSLFTKVVKVLSQTRDRANVEYLECRLALISTEAGVTRHGNCAPSLNRPTW